MPPADSFFVDCYPTVEGFSDSVRMSLMGSDYLLIEFPSDASEEQVFFTLNFLPLPSSVGQDFPFDYETEIGKDGFDIDEVLYNPEDFYITFAVNFGAGELTAGSIVYRIGSLSVEFKVI